VGVVVVGIVGVGSLGQRYEHRRLHHLLVQQDGIFARARHARARVLQLGHVEESQWVALLGRTAEVLMCLPRISPHPYPI